MLFFFQGDVLDEILNLIESVSEGFPTYPALNDFDDQWVTENKLIFIP